MTRWWANGMDVFRLRRNSVLDFMQFQVFVQKSARGEMLSFHYYPMLSFNSISLQIAKAIPVKVFLYLPSVFRNFSLMLCIFSSKETHISIISSWEPSSLLSFALGRGSEQSWLARTGFWLKKEIAPLLWSSFILSAKNTKQAKGCIILELKIGPKF